MRTTIERGFGILKKRFCAIDSKPHWSYETQVDMVLASCILHNHIIGVDPDDFIMEESTNLSTHSMTQRINLSQREEREENREWLTKRDLIAAAI